MVRDRREVLRDSRFAEPLRRLTREDRVGGRFVGDDFRVRRAPRELGAERLHDSRSLLDRNAHPFLAAVGETVVGFVHRTDVLQRDVLAVVQPLDNAREILRVRGFAARFEVPAARLCVGCELRRRTVDETGENRNVGVICGGKECSSRDVGRFLVRRTRRILHADAAAPDVVAISRQRDALRGEEHVGDVLLHIVGKVHEIVRPPRARRAEPVDRLRGRSDDMRDGEVRRRCDRGRRRRRGLACVLGRRARREDREHSHHDQRARWPSPVLARFLGEPGQRRRTRSRRHRRLSTRPDHVPNT